VGEAELALEREPPREPNRAPSKRIRTRESARACAQFCADSKLIVAVERAASRFGAWLNRPNESTRARAHGKRLGFTYAAAVTRLLRRRGRHVSPTIETRFVLGTLALWLLASCGARSQLLPAEEACGAEGQERPCGDVCGTGSQTCSGGYWQACEVAPTSRSCSDTCGTGSQTCANGA